MASETPGPGTPGGEPSGSPGAGEAPLGGQPAAAVPPEAPPAAAAESAEAAPTTPDEPSGQSQAGWGQPPPLPAPATAAQPPWAPWGSPPPAQPPVGSGGWGPPGAPVSPPPQQPAGRGPAPGTQGAPPATWNPQPATADNGCLKACLIVGIVVVVLAVVFFIAVALLGMKFATDIGVTSNGSLKACELISNDQLGEALGGQPQAAPLVGLGDATIGRVLDNRILPDAPDCWIMAGGAGSSVTGRLAREDTPDAASIFKSEKAGAASGGYLAGELAGIGDESFCTGASDATSVGVMARAGNRLVYVSLIDGAGAGNDLQTTADGVVTSLATCRLAGKVAQQMLR
jgi:hypothetical protein